MKKEIVFILIAGLLVLLLAIIFIVALKENKSKSIDIKVNNNYNQIMKANFSENKKASIAGTFYPENKVELENELEGFLSKAEKIISEKVRIIILPHAGIDYSGQVVAWGIKQIEGEDFDKVILLGASHQYYFQGAEIWSGGNWQTPLGEIEIDYELAGKIGNGEEIFWGENYHDKEHSLEVELPFLQKKLENFKIVPIILGQVSEDLIDKLAEQIFKNLDEKTLLVISTDLSHYPNYEEAKKEDRKTIEAILSGSDFYFKERLMEKVDFDTFACGEKAIRVGMKVAEKLGISWDEIFYQNSGDVTKEKDRVVGYASLVVAKKKEFDFREMEKDEDFKKEALTIARNSLVAWVENRNMLDLKEIGNKYLFEKLGAFVTLKKEGQLRGCIGSFEPNVPLYQVIKEMAKAASTEDTRFSPVKKEELNLIKLEISVMTPRHRIEEWKDIKLGEQGVVIKKGNRSGTFLPQVARETGWSLEEFLGHLCKDKAGLDSNCYLDKETEIWVYEVVEIAEKN